MKRIYSDIPLESVTFYTPGYIKITVVDMKASDIHYNRENGNPVGVWEGFAKDSVKIPYRYQYAKIHHMEVPEQNHVVYYISTQTERY